MGSGAKGSRSPRPAAGPVTAIHGIKLPMSFVSFAKAAIAFAGTQFVLAVVYMLPVRG